MNLLGRDALQERPLLVPASLRPLSSGAGGGGGHRGPAPGFGADGDAAEAELHYLAMRERPQPAERLLLGQGACCGERLGSIVYGGGGVVNTRPNSTKLAEHRQRRQLQAISGGPSWGPCHACGVALCLSGAD